MFDRLRSVAQEENRGLYAILDQGQLLERRAGQLRIALPEGFGARRLATRIADFEAICERVFGCPTRIEFETHADAAGSAAATHRPPDDSDLARRRSREALEHAGINDALDILGGEIVDIRPIS